MGRRKKIDPNAEDSLMEVDEDIDLEDPEETVAPVVPLQEYLDTSRIARSHGDYALHAFRNACHRHRVYHKPSMNHWETVFQHFMNSSNSNDAFASEVNK